MIYLQIKLRKLTKVLSGCVVVEFPAGCVIYLQIKLRKLTKVLSGCVVVGVGGKFNIKLSLKF